MNESGRFGRLDDSGILWISSSAELNREEWTEKDSIRSVRFRPNSRRTGIDSGAFRNCRNLGSVSIPASVERIEYCAFEGCSGLTEVIFATGSRLKTISGFDGCTSLSRVEIPASVEEIESYAFGGCSGLTEVIFATNGCLKRICGFGRCTALSRLRIPASVEMICSSTEPYFGETGFLGDLPRRELIFGPGTHLRPHAKESLFLAFVAFEDVNDLKRRRRQAHS
jgi:hypothetical protein